MISKHIVLKELKLISRNRIIILYLIFSILPFIFMPFIKYQEKNDFITIFFLFFIANSFFFGYGAFIWAWEKQSYRLFYLKGKLQKLLFNKIVMIYILQFINALFLFILFIDTNYFRDYLFAIINSTIFFPMLFIYILSHNITKIDLFDKKLSIIQSSQKQNALISIIIIIQAVLYILLTLFIQDYYLLGGNFVLNVLLFYLFSKTLFKKTHTQIRKNLL